MRQRLKSRLTPWWKPLIPVFYWGLVTCVRFALMTLTHWSTTGRGNMPAKGPVIVVSNHLNNSDPGILSAGVLGRRIRYMAKIELFSGPVSPFIKLYGAFPVRRLEADVGALLTAERILRDGGVIGMFPEGHRSRDRQYNRQHHAGTAMIALRSGATILPCAIVGTDVLSSPLRLIHRPPMSVHVGIPFPVEKVRKPTEAQVNAMRDRIVNEIAALLPERYTRAYTEMDEGTGVGDGGDHPRD